MTEAIEAAKRILKSIRRTKDEYGVTYESDSGWCIGLQEPYLVASALLLLAEPEWGEPVAEGWHWIEGINIPCYVYKNDPEDAAENGQWSFSGFDVDSDGYDHRPLNGRRVAPCVGRPRKAGE